MSKLYFGKFQDEKQINGHYYKGNSSWYNGLQVGDYVFVIKSGVKALWKASYFEELGDDGSNLHFDEIIPFSAFQIKDLVAIKEFKLDVDLCVKTSRSTGSEKKGFYEIELIHPDEIDNFLDASSFQKYIQNKANYRSVIFFDDKNKIDESSEDVQFYKENGSFHIYEDKVHPFISPEMIAKFKDNVESIKDFYKNKPEEDVRRSKKLKTISYIEESLSNDKPIYKDEQSLQNFYDVFFSAVKLSSKKKTNIQTEEISEESNDEILSEGIIISNQINTILFGPPGTGKTYSTKRKSVKICNGKIDEQTINDDYEKLLSENRINFVTFHQSFGYEEFVEGIKPIISDDEDSAIRYEIKDGVLKAAAINASYEYVKAKNTIKSKKSKSTTLDDNFENRWDQMLSEMREKLDSNDLNVRKFKTRKGADMYLERISDNGNLKFKVTDISYTVSFGRTKKLWNAFDDVTKIKNIDKEIRAVIGGANSTSYYITLEYLQKMKFDSKNSITVSDENLSIEEKKKFVNALTNSDYTNTNVKNHVLIIDEINRGNVAQIFGELITLVEKSKRAGSKDAVKIQLSYSGESFILPPNLFIIGTMNTSDRSVESLDAALRRRFSFEELAPNSDSLSGITVVDENNEELEIDLSEMLDIINKRLEFLLDHDHTIGHAYFSPEVHQDEENTDFITLKDLKQIFVNSIIPQLKEYFYNDWEKIQMVLSPKFIEERKDVSLSKLFFYGNTDIIDDEKRLFEVSDSTSWNEETFQSIYLKK